jgi:hypothetical protein
MFSTSNVQVSCAGIISRSYIHENKWTNPHLCSSQKCKEIHAQIYVMRNWKTWPPYSGNWLAIRAELEWRAIVVLRAEQPAQAAVHLDDHLSFKVVDLAVDSEPHFRTGSARPEAVRARLIEPCLISGRQSGRAYHRSSLESYSQQATKRSRPQRHRQPAIQKSPRETAAVR